MALNQTQANEMRTKLFETLDFSELTVEGRTKEGLAFTDSEGNVVVMKLIAKKDNFDLADALEEYEESQEKASEKKKKADEKKKKDQEKKAKEKEKVETEKEKVENEDEDKVLAAIGL